MNKECPDKKTKRSRRFDQEDIKIPPTSSISSFNNESPTTKTNTKSSKISSKKSRNCEFLAVNEDPMENEKEEIKKISKGLFIINDRFELTPANHKKTSYFFGFRKKLQTQYKKSKSLEKYLDKVEEQKNEEEPVQIKRMESKRIGRRKISLPTDGNEFNRKLVERKKEMHIYMEESPIKEDVLEFEDKRKRPFSLSHINRSSRRSLKVDEIDRVEKSTSKYYYDSNEGSFEMENIENIIQENPEDEKEEKDKIERLDGSSSLK